jgi:DNA-binding NarL/FixJ family response regulator
MIRLMIIMEQEQDLLRVSAAAGSSADLRVVGTGTDPYQAIRLAETEQPDIAVIDCRIGGGETGIVSLVKRRSPGTAVILVSPREDEERAAEALSRGASAYLALKSDMDILAAVIYIVHAGGCYVSHRIVNRVFQILPGLFTYREFYRGLLPAGSAGVSPDRCGPVMLSSTEWQIIRMVGQGRTTKEVGGTLGLKEGTVRNYISALMRKTGIRSRYHMALFVLNHGRRRIEERRGSPALPPPPLRPRKLLPLLEAVYNVNPEESRVRTLLENGKIPR